MLAPLVLALACATSPSPPVAAQSLPLDAGPASTLAEPSALMSTMPLMSSMSMSAVVVSDAEAEADAMSPLAVDCEDAAPTPPPLLAVGDCASVWTADMIGTCDLPRATHGRAATLKRGRGPIAGFDAGGGRIGEAPDVCTPDSQSTPFLAAARLTLTPPPFVAALSTRAFGDPPAAPARRLDRPPRA